LTSHLKLSSRLKFVKIDADGKPALDNTAAVITRQPLFFCSAFQFLGLMSKSDIQSLNSEAEFITKKQLADRLKVSTRTIEKWVASGKISCAKIGHTVRFDWAAVCRAIAPKPTVSAASPTKVTAYAPANQQLKLLAKNLRTRRISIICPHEIIAQLPADIPGV